MKLGRQWERRFEIWDEAFESNIYKKIESVDLEGFTTMEYLTWKEAQKMRFRKFPVGTSWGAKWEYGWFRTKIRLWDEVTAGKRLVLHLGAGSEMLVFVNRKEAGSIDAKHKFVELTPSHNLAQVYEVYAEVYAGHGPRKESGGIFPRDAVPVPEPPEQQCVIKESHYGIFDEDYYRVYVDYHTLYGLWKALPESSPRCIKIGQALQEFTCTADFEAEEQARKESILRAHKLLKPLLEKKNSDTAAEYTIFGQSHLDLVWLWTWQETKRKCARTYANQIALMERYPDYRFLLCEPPILEHLKEHYPKLYYLVKEKVAAGRMIPEGAVYVECDTNMAGSESLVRQFVVGKRWFLQEFGVDSKLAWLPDTFGFSAALPQIMAGCRVPYFATQKLLRCDPECEQFPYNIFWWEGIDGTKVLSHIYKECNADFEPEVLVRRWEEDRNQRQEIDCMMFPFGYGDGGGGPTEQMVDTALRCRDLEGLPRCRMESPTAFFERLSAKDIKNTYYGELYLAWHRGTYTAQAKIKKGVRRAEYALREAEYLAGLLRLTGKHYSAQTASTYNKEDNTVYNLPEDEKSLMEKIDALWRKLLFQEFHDILPGSSIQRANKEAVEALEQVEHESRQLAEALLYILAEGEAVFNSLSWERAYRKMTLPSCGYIKTACEIPEILQLAEQEQLTKKTICAMGVPSQEGGLIIQNNFYHAEVDCFGRIVHLTDQNSGYEYAKEALNDWKLYRDVNVDYDAWELGRMYERMEEELAGATEIHVKQSEEEVQVEISRREANFTSHQVIHFFADTPRIDFETTMDWRERHKILKVDFPTAVYTKEVLEEIQFGYLKRPTHRSRQYEKDLYETCHHKYAVLTDGENGFAVLNNCKYGISAQDSRLSLTLLRSPVLPDMNADQGEHTFGYSILLFHGPFTESRVLEEAYERNIEVTDISSGNKAVQTVSFFRLEGGHAVIETLKPAYDEENGIVLRMYEAKGCAGYTKLILPPQVKHAYACNMLEEKESRKKLEIADNTIKLYFRPFEIKTVLLEICTEE